MRSTQLPIATGETPLTYSLTGPSGRPLGEAVPGMSFDASPGARRLAGTPTRHAH